MINPKLRDPMGATREYRITGYLDRLSERAGASLSARVSTEASRFDVRLVRVISADCNPDGPGMKFEDLGYRFAETFPGGRQPIEAGSYVFVPRAPTLERGAARIWTALCWVACDPEGEMTILEHAGTHSTLSLSIAAGGLKGVLSAGAFAGTVEVTHVLEAGVWNRVWIGFDPVQGRLGAGIEPLGGRVAFREVFVANDAEAPSGGMLTIAAKTSKPRCSFTGKIEAPELLVGQWSAGGWASVSEGLVSIASWDFSQHIGSSDVAGCGPEGHDGWTVNDPTRAVIGASWSGQEMCWRHAPAEYAAIHFHADDTGDFGWKESFSFQIPQDMKSGAYALHLKCDLGEDWLPFYVLPPKQGPKAKVAFLAPTYTYLAYANCFFGNRTRAGQARAAAWGAPPYNGREYGSYGRSTYNRHVDGSGVCLSSRLRPILSMRPGYMYASYDMKGSGVRHYPADTHLLAWLEAKGVDFDVVTDEDLDDEGVGLIEQYAAVLTGSHPEYHTATTLDAIQAYVSGGGNLAYLGANGFYWRIARERRRPDLIEVRRAEGGIRLWAAETGEYYHALDGKLGGLWRRNGRFPQALTGIGFSAQGPFEAGFFRRTAASREGPFAWIFDGVEGDIFGDYGLSAGGAAGFELDRMDHSLGSPAASVVLATSDGLPPTFGLVPEDMLTESRTLVGEPPASLIRGDMTFTPFPGGGSVFAAGSITFCGSLWREGKAEGPVSTILENVLASFIADRTPPS